MPLKLWVQLKSNNDAAAAVNRPTQVPTKDCENVDDFIKAIKRELSPKLDQVAVDDITFHLTANSPALEPGLALSNIASQPGYTANTDKSPLIVMIPPSADPNLDLDNRPFKGALSKEEPRDSSIAPMSPLKQRQFDYLLRTVKKYLLRTDHWRCVTVISKRRAVTFAHREHLSLEPGMSIKIYPMEGESVYDVTVKQKNVREDWVLLECDVDLCEEAPKIGLTVDGRDYIQLGLSATSQLMHPFSVSRGVISSSRVNEFGHILGSAGANPGDSGGPCFHDYDGELIGINVGCENTPISLDNDTGTQIHDKIASRYASRAHLIPVCMIPR